MENKLFHKVSTEDKKVDNGKEVVVKDKMQKNYKYYRTAKTGEWSKEFPDFKPELTPQEMLSLGVFEGKYLNDCKGEFPSTLYKGIKASDTPNPEVNYFKVKSRQPLSVWKKNGWIHKDDPRGWFQWYVRFYYGRRHEDDTRQIGRWKSFVARHTAQVVKNCKKKDNSCRIVQKQGLLQWAIDSRKL
jgi:hypothetical protein